MLSNEARKPAIGAIGAEPQRDSCSIRVLKRRCSCMDETARLVAISRLWNRYRSTPEILPRESAGPSNPHFARRFSLFESSPLEGWEFAKISERVQNLIQFDSLFKV